ncbi:hypothetical protein H6G93_08395 [Nostoc sp. FACHB-973]|nr:hypothetical protein [Nostoc sp. FACHB-973]MBX9252643.1 hypothetical protein [Desmonostoc muscorum CCALA 125]
MANRLSLVEQKSDRYRYPVEKVKLIAESICWRTPKAGFLLAKETWGRFPT